MKSGCGETSEITAARAHRIVALFYSVAFVALIPALLIEAAMTVWHIKSGAVHDHRAMLAEER